MTEQEHVRAIEALDVIIPALIPNKVPRYEIVLTREQYLALQLLRAEMKDQIGEIR